MSVANKKKSECCGCNACEEICPKHCIRMVEDAKGFLYPQIDHSVCVECSLCEKVCPFNKDNLSLHTPLTAYAAWNKNREEYLGSSSGGAAYVLSSYILKKGGVVYGCTADGINIRHIRIEKQLELYRLQGSKYVQSDVRGLYKKVSEDLKAERPVLFIGTPCQVAGLKNYIKQIPEYLYLVDLICHGVPSQKMLKEHITRILKGRSAEQLSFRKGQLFRIELTTQCGTVYFLEPHKDMYYKAFLNGFSYRESCYQCPFAQQERVSDITVGDFWGLQDADASFPKEGISVLLPCTDKGLRLITSVKDRMAFHKRPVEEAVRGNSQLQAPVKITLRSRLFSCFYPLVPFDTLMHLLILDQKMKTAIRLCFKRMKYGFKQQ